MSPATPAFSLIYCPHPPARARRALFPAGRGRFWFFLCKGLRPLHPRGWMGRGTGSTCVWRYLAGGLPSLSPAAPAFSLLCRPHPPPPFPAGRGRFLVYFAGGSAPGTPASDRLRHLQNLPNNKYPAAEPGRHHLPGTLSIGFAVNHRFSPGDARGGAPCMK